MQGEFCQKLPPWVYGGVQLEGASLLYIRWEIVSSGRGDFAACGRRVTFPAMGKSPKDRRGTAQDERFALIFALPPVPHYEGRKLESVSGISGAQNLNDTLNSRRATGPWVCKNCRWCGSTSAPGFAEQVIVGLLSACRPVSGPYEKEGPASRSAVGAGVLTRPSRTVFHSWAGRPVSGPYEKEGMFPDSP